MRTLLVLMTIVASLPVVAGIESCEKKYIDAYGYSQTAATQICSMNDFGRKLVRKGYSISHAQKMSENESGIEVDKCEEDTELMGYKEEFAIEICKLSYCEKMLVMEGSSAELAKQECSDESLEIESNLEPDSSVVELIVDETL